MLSWQLLLVSGPVQITVLVVLLVGCFKKKSVWEEACSGRVEYLLFPSGGAWRKDRYNFKFEKKEEKKKRKTHQEC